MAPRGDSGVHDCTIVQLQPITGLGFGQGSHTYDAQTWWHSVLTLGNALLAVSVDAIS